MRKSCLRESKIDYFKINDEASSQATKSESNPVKEANQNQKLIQLLFDKEFNERMMNFGRVSKFLINEIYKNSFY